MKNKICVGLSGGVDSAVAALLLKEQGYDVFGMFMQNWHDADATLHGDCEWEEDRFVAEMTARKIGIPFYFIDLSKEYRKKVVDYMFDEYARGRTPNPDVLCNKEIKFDAFLKAAEKLGADAVATGHYCRRKETPLPDGRILYSLLEGSDPNKDQSYFLCRLSQEQLSKAVFPIGDMKKKDVRRLAAEADLPCADKKDSQGICFVGKVDLPTFLKQKLESREGQIIEVFDDFFKDNSHYHAVKRILESILKDGEPLEMSAPFVLQQNVLTSDGEPLGESPYKEDALAELTDEDLEQLCTPFDYSTIQFEQETYRSGKKHVKKTRYKDNPFGKIIGTHEGAQFYTVGQRKGLGIGGHKEPVFVLATDTAAAHKGLSSHCLKMDPDEVILMREDLRMEIGEMRRHRVRIRYRQPLQGATLLRRASGLYILFDIPQRGITPGQFAVWYTGEEMIGSGVIA